MYQIIKKGNEYQLFNIDVINSIYETIGKEAIDLLKTIKDPKKYILGCFAIGNVPLLDGSITNLWIEYNAEILPIGIDVGIHNAIIFDEIPDIVLDKYNNVKMHLFNKT